MTVFAEVVYPSVSLFSSPAQLNLGPFGLPVVNKLLRLEARGQVNFQGVPLAANGVHANLQLWAVQWVPSGSAPADCITTPDGPSWLIREQTGTQDTVANWAPTSGPGIDVISYGLKADWAGQLPIGFAIDLWLSAKAPTGVTIPNMNLFASLRFWWS